MHAHARVATCTCTQLHTIAHTRVHNRSAVLNPAFNMADLVLGNIDFQVKAGIAFALEAVLESRSRTP